MHLRMSRKPVSTSLQAQISDRQRPVGSPPNSVATCGPRGAAGSRAPHRRPRRCTCRARGGASQSAGRGCAGPGGRGRSSCSPQYSRNSRQSAAVISDSTISRRGFVSILDRGAPGRCPVGPTASSVTLACGPVRRPGAPPTAENRSCGSGMHLPVVIGRPPKCFRSEKHSADRARWCRRGRSWPLAGMKPGGTGGPPPAIASAAFHKNGSAVTPDGVKPSPRSLMDAVNHAFSSLFGGGGKLGRGPWSSFELGLGS